MKWQPIETAPKDGTHFDVWSSSGERYAKCKYGNFRGEKDLCWWRDVPFNKDGEWVRLNVSMFTHWMPLPEAPNV